MKVKDSAGLTSLHPAPFGSVARERVPTHTHWTTTGEGDASVECRFDIDEDGDISTLQVWLGNTNIFQALTLAQVIELEAECLAAAEADYNERKYDTAIDAYIERRAA